MDTNVLKKFARDSRAKLLSQVEAKLTYVLSTDTVELRSKEKQLNEIREQVRILGKENFVEKIAYTWFNRFTALRFMDLNNHTFIKIVSPPEGFTLPEILSEAKNGHIDDRLKVDRERLNKILDGILPSSDPQGDVYKNLFIAACNYYNSILPFMFEKIEDYTELLLPDDLLSENSVLMNLVKNLNKKDCEDVEIIGWLYQFYISEKNDEVINAKKRYKTEEIPAATQLFTPHWIVKYIVENTLGRMWLEAKPDSPLKDYMGFYIEPIDKDKIPTRTINSPEEIKFLDPASGSAHILVYAFELFTKIYEEEGYDKPDIPRLIIEKNLYGLEIDERAAALGSFALTMKATSYHNRYLRAPLIPQIYVFENSDEVEQFKNAKDLGTLIRISKGEHNNIKVEEGSIFYEKQKRIKEIANVLIEKYDCVVTNPPYVNSSYFNKALTDFTNENYKETKADLFATFLVRSRELTKSNGMIGYVSPFVWMFIKSFEKLRDIVIEETTIETLVRPSYTAFFDSAIVPLCAYVLRNQKVNSYRSTFFDLDYLGNAEEQIPRLLDGINNPNSKRKFFQLTDNFKKIPNSPLAYWVSERVMDAFQRFDAINSLMITRKGMVTGDNEYYIRFWWEIEFHNIGFELTRKEAKESGLKWFPQSKGGEYRKWYGNNYSVVNWHNDGEELQTRMHPTDNRIQATNFNLDKIFEDAVTWSKISSTSFSVRYQPKGFLFNDASANGFPFDSKHIFFILGFLTTKVPELFLDAINPTMNYLSGDIDIIPTPTENLEDQRILSLCINSLSISRNEWDSSETSWDFKKSELLRLKENGQIQTAYNYYCNHWKEKFFQLHKNEEELNRIFIDIYDLQEELTPDVDLKDITILKQETEIAEDAQLQFNADEIIRQFISYAVGCMFGRYSLDKEGLILANQGETLKHYLQKVPSPTFMPDEDAIIPVLEDDYFVDDITGRFRDFLKVSFGEEHYNENISFVEEALGKDIRKYFAKDFYSDHIKRYKKRPIYWMFSSPKKSFNALIYMHRYKSDTVSKLLNDYVREFQEKLKAKKQHLTHIVTSESSRPADKTKAQREINKIEAIEVELQQYEREILYPLATQKIEIDLDDGVKVNYNKFGNALQKVTGLTE